MTQPPPYIWIDQPEAFANLIARLQNEPYLAIDTESNSLHAYRERVCLIQISIPGADYLVDPLALADLSALGEVLSDPRVEKIFHAAEYDLICLRRDYGFSAANIFDTMWAARVLGWKAVGLGPVLEQVFGVKLDKRHQRADWGHRPLPKDLLEYAYLDSHYLIELRHRLYAELEAAGRMPAAQEDFERLTRLTDREIEDTRAVDGWRRINGARDLDPTQLAVLREVYFYRERVAEARDRPVFRVLGDSALISVAQAMPASVDELAGLDGFTSRMVSNYAEGLLRAVAQGKKAAPLYMPNHEPRPSQVFLNRMEKLREWRKQAGIRMGVESDVILPRNLMLEIAHQNPRNLEELRSILWELPWRVHHFGTDLLKSLR